MKDGWVELKGSLTAADVKELAACGRIEKLSVTELPILTASLAQSLSSVTAVTQLWLWCDVTRAAMRHVLSIPELAILDVLNIRSPGRLRGFALATSLREFRCNLCLTDVDLLEVASCHSLQVLGAQSSELTVAAVTALVDMPELRSLDLEGSNFDDNLAELLCKSSSLLSLDVGSTRLTREGLRYICRMKQLKSLDLWASAVTEQDIELLTDLPHLEYLSVGGVKGAASFDADSLLPKLHSIKALERIWLDGVRISPATRRQLEERYKSVRITSESDA